MGAVDIQELYHRENALRSILILREVSLLNNTYTWLADLAANAGRATMPKWQHQIVSEYGRRIEAEGANYHLDSAPLTSIMLKSLDHASDFPGLEEAISEMIGDNSRVRSLVLPQYGPEQSSGFARRFFPRAYYHSGDPSQGHSDIRHIRAAAAELPDGPVYVTPNSDETERYAATVMGDSLDAILRFREKAYDSLNKLYTHKIVWEGSAEFSLMDIAEGTLPISAPKAVKEFACAVGTAADYWNPDSLKRPVRISGTDRLPCAEFVNRQFGPDAVLDYHLRSERGGDVYRFFQGHLFPSA